MINKKLFLGTLTAIIIVTVVFALAQEGKKQAMTPDMSGTYKLVSRTLPDGSKVMPPDIQGLQTYTADHRNFNVMWKLPDDKFFSYSVVSTYKLSPKEYTETLLYSVMVDQSKSPDPVYNLSGETKTAAIDSKDGNISFQMPFDPPRITFTGSTFTATAPGFTDYWEKIK